MAAVWTPGYSEEGFNSRMENAFRRVSGSIGYELSRDLGNSRHLRNTAGDAIQSGLDPANGPLFLRMGKGAMTMSRYRPGGTVDLKDCAGEILREFYEEGTGAYVAVKAELRCSARNHLLAAGYTEPHIDSLLTSADSIFLLPDKDAFSKAAFDLCHEAVAPVTKAVIVGALVFAPVITVMRNPVIAAVAGVAATLAAYYVIRSSRVAKVDRMLHVLPKRLYDLLATGLKTNARRYAETINAGLKSAGISSEE